MALSASQRLKLIKAISDRLSQEEWSLIDVTLKHFELPTSDEWSGDKDSYLIHMVEDASDQVLFGICQRL